MAFLREEFFTCAHFQFSAVSALAVSSHRKVRCTAGNTDFFAGVLILLQKNTTKGKKNTLVSREETEKTLN